jgi:hypothetical protein
VGSNCRSSCGVRLLDLLASCDRGIDRYPQWQLKALGPLAVAERDIRARSPAQHSTRADRARSGDSPAARARLALSVRQDSTTTAPQPPRTAQRRDGLTPPQPLAVLASLRSSSTVRASSDEPSLAPLTKTSRGFRLAHESAHGSSLPVRIEARSASHRETARATAVDSAAIAVSAGPPAHATAAGRPAGVGFDRLDAAARRSPSLPVRAVTTSPPCRPVTEVTEQPSTRRGPTTTVTAFARTAPAAGTPASPRRPRPTPRVGTAPRGSRAARVPAGRYPRGR